MSASIQEHYDSKAWINKCSKSYSMWQLFRSVMWLSGWKLKQTCLRTRRWSTKYVRSEAKSSQVASRLFFSVTVKPAAVSSSD